MHDHQNPRTRVGGQHDPGLAELLDLVSSTASGNGIAELQYRRHG
jgi:hypothetical protein